MNKINDLKIEIFADGADLKSIKRLNNLSYISGFTTNPSLMKKAEVTDYKEFALDALKIIGNKPISFEVFSDELDEMEQQAHEIASWGNNIFVKIPITNSKGIKTCNLVKKLSEKSIKCNVTAILTLNQVKEIYEIANLNTDMVVSIFAGRIADTGLDPIPTMKNAIDLCKNNKKIKILWASTREVLNIIQANNIGCHIITVPNSILEKTKNLGKDLKELSLDTVKDFLSDAQKANYKIKKT